MKKLCVFVMISLILVGLKLEPINSFNASDVFSGCKAVVCVENNYKSQELNGIKTGDMIFVETEQKDVVGYKQMYDVIGVTYCVEGDIEDLISRLNVKVVECNDISVDGYSNYFKDYLTINGKRVNVQLAKRGDFVYVCNPLIVGSY